MSKSEVCLGRFHDGTAKPNWGGRGTSLGLGRVIRRDGYELTSTINGNEIVNDFGIDTSNLRRTRLYGRWAARSIPSVLGHRGRAPHPHGVMFGEESGIAHELLSRRVKPDRLRRVIAALDTADEFWMNGEGDFILRPRPSLFRTLVLMHMAHEMGKRVVLVNSVLSEPTVGQMAPTIRESVGEALSVCSKVVYRDPVSLELHEELYAGVAASWMPDALFTWTEEGQWMAELGGQYGPLSEQLDPVLQASLPARRWVAISGSSRLGPSKPAASSIAATIAGLRAAQFEPILVATDQGDGWLRSLAAKQGAPFIPAAIPLATAMALLARVDCFLSGRYHPAILAATVGTPGVFFGSNSHKTASLQRVLGDDPCEFPLPGGGFPVDDVVERVVATAGNFDRAERTARSLKLGRSISFV